MELPATDAADQTPPPRAVSADPFPEDQRVALGKREESALILFYDCYFDRVYGYVRRMVGEEHLDVAATLTNLALLYNVQ